MRTARGETIERDETMSNWYNEGKEELRALSNTCQPCGRPVIGAGVDELGKRFHSECYAAKSQNGDAPKDTDAEARAIVPPAPMKPRTCEFCNLPIYGTATQIGAKRWHPDCFGKVNT